MQEKTILEEKKDLILGDEFEKALTQAAEVKNNNISLCKERNKNNYSTFYDIMLGSRLDVQEAMLKKGKQKTEDVKTLIKNFKSETSQAYKQVCDLITPEELEEGDLTKTQKIVQKVAKVLKYLSYIDNTEMEEEFKKYGIELKYKKLEEENEMFSQAHIKETIKGVFDMGKNIKEDMNKNNEEIKTNIYESSVPLELQYDKSGNPTGIKASDFCKLVDLKAKLIKAKDNEEETEKVKEVVENMAGDYIFQNARNSIINKKLTDLAI